MHRRLLRHPISQPLYIHRIHADATVGHLHADAIFSIASYLKHYGWKPGISREKAYKVVYHYNHSKYYVNTVLDIADKLKG